MAFTLTQTAVSPKVSEKQIAKLQKEMQTLQNEMEFVEILAQFWPFPNMARKMERLEQKLLLLKRQYNSYTALKAS